MLASILYERSVRHRSKAVAPRFIGKTMNGKLFQCSEELHISLISERSSQNVRDFVFGIECI